MIVIDGTTSIFDSSADTLVCPVNCQGVMGNGLALAFKLRVGGLYAAYQAACMEGTLKPGVLWLYRPQRGPQVLCFPTKDRWALPSKLAYIQAGLDTLIEHYTEMGIRRIAIPPLGCGQGQLDWVHCIKPVLIERLTPLSLEVEILAFT